MATRRGSSKATWMRSGRSGDNIYWVLLVLGWFLFQNHYPIGSGALLTSSPSSPCQYFRWIGAKGEGWGEGSNESPSSSKSTPAQAKYRRIDVKPEKNIYDYGPNDPDPTVDYYFEPLNPQEQVKFDKEDRREHGLTEEEIAEYSGTPTQKAKSDPLEHLTQTAATHNTPIHPNPLAPKRKTPPSAAPNQ